MKKRTLLSVYNKDGVVDFARSLQELGYEIISSSGTAKLLKQNGIKVTEVSEVTGFPEIMGGRVKTLHPKIHGGLLAVRDNKEYMKQLKENNVETIDILVVNLYPFEEVAKRISLVAKSPKALALDKVIDELIENIDIGGPAMVRAAAKNHKFTAVIVDPADYVTVLAELKKSKRISIKTKRNLALKAFEHTAFYDSIIASVLNEQFRINEKFPSEFAIPVRRKSSLRYGENPHQQAALYVAPVNTGMSIADSEVIQGKEMSYNNFLDADAAINLVREFSQLAVVIVKHLNPCGVAVGESLVKTYRRALSLDPKSAFGGIVAFNRQVDEATANVLTETFLEVIIAPDFSKKALEVFSKKKNLRIMRVANWNVIQSHPKLVSVSLKRSYKFGMTNDISKVNYNEIEFRKISGGLLLQDKDRQLFEKIKVVTRRKPSRQELVDLIFAFTVVKHVKSNAVVIAKDNHTIGIGPGQTSRVDSLEIAAKKAAEFGLETKGSVLASEAFFPFRDSIDQAAKHGVKAIIQPGGSIKDQEVIKAADEYGIAMVFTGMRHFKH
jgi:phosphoribosylaminoimidazolecarboxamide formyltransferase/IMP cyclohydrolase